MRRIQICSFEPEVFLKFTYFSGPPEQVDLAVEPSGGRVTVTCTVAGCVPLPEVSLAVSGSVTPATSIHTSGNTTTATARLVLPDSADVQCRVAVLGTNFTATVEEHYTRYVAVARPYTSTCHSVRTVRDVMAVVLIVNYLHSSLYCKFLL